MREPPMVRMLPDGRRLHLHDGPIDAIAEAFGSPEEVHRAYHAATQRFATVLDELCEELTLLRQDAVRIIPLLQGSVAQRMANGVKPFARQAFITPMAAVAGAVAEELLHAMTSAATLARAYVNDGGDIALHLTPGESFRVGLVEQLDSLRCWGQRSFRSPRRFAELPPAVGAGGVFLWESRTRLQFWRTARR